MPMTPRCQPVAGDDEDGARADVEVGLDDLLRLRDDLGFFLLPPQILAR